MLWWGHDTGFHEFLLIPTVFDPPVFVISDAASTELPKRQTEDHSSRFVLFLVTLLLQTMYKKCNILRQVDYSYYEL